MKKIKYIAALAALLFAGGAAAAAEPVQINMLGLAYHHCANHPAPAECREEVIGLLRGAYTAGVMNGSCDVASTVVAHDMSRGAWRNELCAEDDAGLMRSMKAFMQATK
ncbi:TPA: hypothetical protein OMU21_004984 [Klebsiella aerogenes]|nr:hypothetical protein [Klebsiella aerogenes]